MSNINKQDRQVSRYDLVSGYMQKLPDGEYVFHSDYQALLDELEAADALNKHLELAIRKAEGCSEALRRRAEAAEKRLEEVRGYNVDLAEESRQYQQQVDELNDALCQLLPGVQYMDPPDGGSVTPLEQVRRMVADYRERIAELETRELVAAGIITKVGE